MSACSGDRRDVLADPSTQTGTSYAAVASSRDASTETNPVASDAGNRNAAGYLYVARRANGLIALAEARNIPNPSAFFMVEQLANELEKCATELQTAGHWGSGALRVSIPFSPDGVAGRPVLQVSPGPTALANGLLCVIKPARELTVPPAPAGTARGISVDATWGNP